MTDLTTGNNVSELESDEHVEIRQIKPFGAKTLIEGVTVTSRREIHHT